MSMATQQLHAEKCFSVFTRSIRADATRLQYENVLRIFKQFMKAGTYGELLTYDVKALQDQLIEYVESLKESGFSTSTIRNRLAGVQHFYVMNDLVLNWAKIYRFVGEYKKTVQDRIYSRQEIQLILEKSDERKRVMFFLLLAGLRIGALPALNLRDLKKWEKQNIYQLTVYAGDKDQYVTFLTPEGTKALDSYLDYRRRYGEILKDDAPLIREQFDPHNAREPRRLTLFGIKTALEKVLVDAGVRVHGTNRAKRQEVMRFHGFRKYFNTMLNEAGVKPIIKEKLMGHKAGLEAAYLRPSETELLNEFMKALSLLTISDAEEWKAKATKLQLTLDERIRDMQAQLDAVNQWKKDKEALEQPQIVQAEKRKKGLVR
jgi:integrase